MSKKYVSKAPASKPGDPGWFPRVGELWPGQGIYAGIVRGEAGRPDHHLFLSADAATYNPAVAWGSKGTDEPGATSVRDGLTNTQALAASGRDHPASAWAVGLKVDGHQDWYLPSRAELRLLWVNTPEHLTAGWYWSSTQYSPYNAWYQYFDGGYQNYNDKAYEGRARAVRRLVIQ
jgi:hypothetical protein